jgi:hypothetical protein
MENWPRGIYSLKFNYSGLKIYTKEYDGYFLFSIRIRYQGHTIYPIQNIYNTSYYNYEDFQHPTAKFADEYGSEAIDSDGNGLLII